MADCGSLAPPELVITQNFRDSRLLLFALKGRWILAGAAATGSKGWVYITKARLISDDEISHDVVLSWNVVGPEKALEFHPVSWTLKRQK